MKKNTFADLKANEKKARQDVIIDAAERVFAVKPFSKVSIRDIAREAGISHASIYRYFPDQQSLFVEAFLCFSPISSGTTSRERWKKSAKPMSPI